MRSYLLPYEYCIAVPGLLAKLARVSWVGTQYCQLSSLSTGFGNVRKVTCDSQHGY